MSDPDDSDLREMALYGSTRRDRFSMSREANAETDAMRAIMHHAMNKSGGFPSPELYARAIADLEKRGIIRRGNDLYCVVTECGSELYNGRGVGQ